MGVDWLKIRNDYITLGLGAEEIARKYGVKASTVRSRAHRGKWADSTQQQRNTVATLCNEKSAQAVAAAEADRLSAASRIGAKAARFLEKRLDTLMECEAKAYEVKAIMETVRLIQDVYDRGPRQPEDDPLVSYLERLGKDE